MANIRDLTDKISPGFTENVLNDILRKQSGFTNVAIKEIKFSFSSKKGDSYLSNITRFTIEGTGNSGSDKNVDFQAHIIVKSIPESQVRAKSFRSDDFFKSEIYFYNQIWPKLDAFQKSKQLPNICDSIPRCFATYSDGKRDFIALENLSFQEFKALDRSSSGLDLDTTLFILRNFARFHALSVAYREQYPNEFQKWDDNLQETYFAEKFRDWYSGTFEKCCNIVKDVAEKDLPPNYLRKLEEMTSQDLFGIIGKLLKKRTPLSAVTHGDCWPPNFLMQQKNGAKKLAFIDFQLCRVASLTTDILFLLYTCVDTAVLKKDWDLILKDYHENFVKALKDLGSKLDITFDMFTEEVQTYGVFAFTMCNEALVMSLMDDDDVTDLDSLKGEDTIPLHQIWKLEPIKDLEKRKRIADYLQHIIDHDLI
ncbi:Ecdysteroid kinase-like family [Popillia japonica]|uniref:Ecdysteroid kinase-like family n=1 Tax=Popillia japonica TaxID=7064 RepID=A0AAW1L9G1_POPJA